MYMYIYIVTTVDIVLHGMFSLCILTGRKCIYVYVCMQIVIVYACVHMSMSVSRYNVLYMYVWMCVV